MGVKLTGYIYGVVVGGIIGLTGATAISVTGIMDIVDTRLSLFILGGCVGGASSGLLIRDLANIGESDRKT